MNVLIKVFMERITQFKPTHVIFNDALTMKLTLHHPLCRTFKRVAIIHTAEQLPFGPFAQGIKGHCLSPKLEDGMLRGLDGIWAVSQSIKDYAKDHGNLETNFLIHPKLTYMDVKTGGMPVARNNIDKTEVGMVNPCPHKGLSILLGLAKELSDIDFVTWKSWGSDPRFLGELKSLKNVQ